MDKSQKLRDFQESVNKRLAAPTEAPLMSWVGVVIGEDNWLVNLADVTEVVGVPRAMPVPHTRPWFLGIANVRGNLYGIVDTAHFWGGPATAIQSANRVLLAHPRFRVNSGLIVRRMLGLRDPGQWKICEPDQGAPAWCARQFVDEEGHFWQELAMAALLADPFFLQIAQK
jgi:twitching motility protein PilI